MREGRRRTQAVALALCDGVMVLFAMQLAWWLRFDLNAWVKAAHGWSPFDVGWTPGQPYVLAVFVTLPIFWLMLRELNLYSEPEGAEGEFFRLSAATLAATILLAAVGFYYKMNYAQQQFQFSRGYMLMFVPSSVFALALGRRIFRGGLRLLARRGLGENRILFVGTGALAEELAQAFDARGSNIIVGALCTGPYVAPFETVNSLPIEKLAWRILEDSFLQQARSVAIAPNEKSLLVHYEIDGAWREQIVLPLESREPLVRRLKALGQLNVHESQVQTGAPVALRCRESMAPIRVRISSAPTPHGEKISFEILRETNAVSVLSTPESETDFQPGSIFPLKVLGHANDLDALARERHCDEVVVALPDAPQTLLKSLAEDCYRAHVRFRMVPDVYEMLLDHMDLALVGDIPLLGMRGSRIEGINFLCKRLFDVLVSGALLLFLVPLVFLPVAVLVKLSSRGPIFYAQERLGFRRRRFKFWKFRSMRLGSDKGADVATHKDYLKKYIAGAAEGARDAKGRVVYKLTQDPRVTPIGRFIRKFSIDELPQLWNVLKGDMSLIGPRPPIAYEVENYRPIHLRRFEVLPGISGLWQVSGRNRLTFEEMVKLDLYYIENWSLELDLRILFKTVSVVLFQQAH